jgi:PPOX class probable F420-dependent enzyme
MPLPAAHLGIDLRFDVTPAIVGVVPERKPMNTIPDSHRDLADQRVATLATIGPDGRPQLSAVWFLIEDQTIRISLNTDRQKTRNLQSDMSVALFILDASGLRYLEIRGDASLEPDDEYRFANRVGQKYLADFRSMDGPGQSRVVVTISPRRVNAVDVT